MCGIAGILSLNNRKPVDAGVLRSMCQVITHRGPDDEGTYVCGNIGLGMRRLSIIDLATGHQPISNQSGTLWIVFNGEIYNHAVLRQQLIAKGYRFSTQSDTEVIVHLYEEHGHDCVKYLRGMFAFAIWDTTEKLLFIARDRLGIKPLYYNLSNDWFLFGSEIKSLAVHPDVSPEFCRAALPEYLAFGYVSGSQTFYKGIHKLMPGHWLKIDDGGGVRIEQYWDLSLQPADGEQNEDYYVRTYRDLLEKAVASHLMSDVPVGVLLSGGLDSSAITALMTRIRGTPVETFSVGYGEQPYSELPYARMVATHLNSVHHEVHVSQQEFFDALPTLIWHEDEPIVWPSSVALYFVARLAREHVKVVLTGEGSDETLAGYSRYAFTLKNISLDRLYRSLVPEFTRKKIQGLISNSRLGAASSRKLAHTFLARDGQPWSSFYFDNFFSSFGEGEHRDLLSDEAAVEFEEGASYRHVLDYWEGSSGSALQRLLYTDIKTYLVELLMKQDSMSMAASIESRVPFLDHELVEFAIGIPQRMQISGLTGKRILRKAVKEILPDSILHRKKLGFPTPWSCWLAGPQLQEIRSLLLESRSLERSLFKPAAVNRLFEEHHSGTRDHSNRIWRLLNLELWQRTCLEKTLSAH